MNSNQLLAGSESILAEAQAVIYGDREQTYGAPDKNLQVIAEMWTSYIAGKTSLDVNDVCCMMVLLKVARLKNSPEHRDSQVDLCGYAALMERVQLYRSKPKDPANKEGPYYPN